MARQEQPHLLVVDDEHFILSALELYFESNNFRVSTASGGQEALQIFRNESDPVDVVILDLVMPGTHGLDLLRTFKQIDSNVQVIIATGCGSMGSAIEALRLGAFDFITKPFLDFDKDLMASVNNALEVRKKQSPSRTRGAGEKDAEDSLASHWLTVYEQLNLFADRYVGKPPSPPVLHAIWNVLEEGFRTEAAAVLAPAAEAGWKAIHIWGYEDLARFNECFEGVLRSLPIAEKPAPAVAERLAQTFNTATASLEGSLGSRWRKVLHLPLLSSGDTDRSLLLFHGEGAIEPETGPLALLATILSPILTQQALDTGGGAARATASCES